MLKLKINKEKKKKKENQLFHYEVGVDAIILQLCSRALLVSSVNCKNPAGCNT